MDPLIVIASNRGPFTFQVKKDGTYTVRRGPGGLVTALGALAEEHDVLWTAAAMNEQDRRWVNLDPDRPRVVEDILIRLVLPEQDAYDRYYNVIANPLLWFLQHQLWDTPRAPQITRDIWEAWEQGYKPINRQFAEGVADSIADADRPVIVLPQDYHLYMFPQYLRDMVGDRVQIQPFIHIPWPGPDAWRILPPAIRNELLASLLCSDRIGFQTMKDAFNFVQTCRFYLEGASSRGSRDTIHYRGREVQAVAYPISIDTVQLEALVEEPQTHLLKSQFINFVGDRNLILRVDRIEPSKNILRGLAAYRSLLENYPEHRGVVQMLALLVPSRMEVGEYQNYLQEIMAAAGMINAEFSEAFWEPVRIVVGENYPRAIAAMQLYDVLLVNSIADGMNLVAKEGALVNTKDGVIVLSEHVGAFYEMGEHTLPVSPFDIYGTTRAMHTALVMEPEERRRRAEALKDIVQDADVRRWFANQVEDAIRASTSQASSDSTPPTPPGEQIGRFEDRFRGGIRHHAHTDRITAPLLPQLPGRPEGRGVGCVVPDVQRGLEPVPRDELPEGGAFVDFDGRPDFEHPVAFEQPEPRIRRDPGQLGQQPVARRSRVRGAAVVDGQGRPLVLDEHSGLRRWGQGIEHGRELRSERCRLRRDPDGIRNPAFEPVIPIVQDVFQADFLPHVRDRTPGNDGDEGQPAGELPEHGSTVRRDRCGVRIFGKMADRPVHVGDQAGPPGGPEGCEDIFSRFVPEFRIHFLKGVIKGKR